MSDPVIADPQLKAAVEEVLADSNDTNWCVFNFDGKNIVFNTKGTDGLHGLLAALEDDQAQFAYLRSVSGDAESKRAKFSFITWVGESVGALKRAKISVIKASAKKVIQNYGTEFHFTEKDELDETAIMTKIKKAGGADYSGNTSQN
ncbi:hypothetical protein CYY_008797 [Polysphondylium violaceum]|uniref:Coactosin n=1 Tax=Polysphondylium violaceum TaxID=133409 RepID=A0A8J4V0Z8_9MYCE|nr:hypothetical protein CYY_008797 [Polysphondylium violaceum]